MKKVRLLGLSHKMKNKIREHGEIWEVQNEKTAKLWSVATLKPVHFGQHPYQAWVTLSQDVEVLQVIEDT